MQNTVKPVFKGYLNIPEKVSLHDKWNDVILGLFCAHCLG